VRLGFHGVEEKDEYIDITAGNKRPYLLITSERTTKQGLYRAVQALLEQLTGGAGSDEFMPSQHHFIKFGPFDEILLFIVMRHHGDAFPFI
jgi:hypothetical protein